MEIQIALTTSQFKRLLVAFAGIKSERKMQLLHSVRRVVENRRSVVKNSIQLHFVGWGPTADEAAALEVQIRDLIESVVTPSTIPFTESCAAPDERRTNERMFVVVKEAVNVGKGRRDYARQAKAIRF